MSVRAVDTHACVYGVHYICLFGTFIIDCSYSLYVDEERREAVALQILCESLTPKTSKDAIKFIYAEYQVGNHVYKLCLLIQ